MKTIVTTITVAACALATTGFATAQRAPATGQQTTRSFAIALDNEHVTRTAIDMAPLQSASHPGDTPGDEVVINGPVIDHFGHRQGMLDANFMTMTATDRTGNSTEQMTGTLSLKHGTLSVQGVTSALTRHSTMAVVGGTGAYGGATGVVKATFTPEAVRLHVALTH
jgi:hypothetical protein